jgi:hypothetical protein
VKIQGCQTIYLIKRHKLIIYSRRAGGDCRTVRVTAHSQNNISVSVRQPTFIQTSRNNAQFGTEPTHIILQFQFIHMPSVITAISRLISDLHSKLDIAEVINIVKKGSTPK